MSLFQKDNIKSIFLHKDSNFTLDEHVNIILSSELYWVREFSIPVTNEKEAFKFVGSFFEDILDDKEYKYFVEKIEDKKFLCFAYSELDIKEAIKKANINISQVVNVYFGQFELKDFKSFEIDNKTFIFQNGILVKLPRNIEITTQEMPSVEDLKLSNKKVKLDLYPKWLSGKTLYSICVLLFLVSMVNFAQVYSYNHDISKFDEDKNLLKKRYQLPSSNIQLKAIVKKELKSYHEKNSLKDAMSYLLSYKKEDNSVEFVSVEYGMKQINIKLTTKNKKQADKINRYITKKYKVTMQKENLDYTFKVAL